jgi:serine/threonine protein kinase
MPLTAGSRLGPYEITASIGSGAMGDVYRAQDLRLGRTVVLKVLPERAARDPERHRSFEQEARAVAALNHPHICVLYDIGSDSGTEFLVMEFLDGQTLAEHITKGPLPLEQALDVGIQIVDALDNAHRMGIVHRDLKPGNVMLTKSGAKLLDFGIAELAADPSLQRTRAATLPGLAPARLVGTPCYMSPEQAKGLGPDQRSDIFSIGVVLYEMLTGRRPFQGESLTTVLSAILHEAPPPLTRLNPCLPPGLGPIIDRCLAKEPARRYQHVGDLRRDLEDLRSDLAASARAHDRPATG